MRYLTPFIVHDLQKKMVFLGGPRQCGKTTLAQNILEDKGPRKDDSPCAIFCRTSLRGDTTKQSHECTREIASLGARNDETNEKLEKIA